MHFRNKIEKVRPLGLAFFFVKQTLPIKGFILPMCASIGLK